MSTLSETSRPMSGRRPAGMSRQPSPSSMIVRRRNAGPHLRMSVTVATSRIRFPDLDALLGCLVGRRADRSGQAARLGHVEPLADLTLDPVARVRVLAQVVLRGLAALTEAFLAAGEPRPGLAHDALFD